MRDPFEALTKQHADAVPDLAVRLRDSLRARRADLKRELVALGRGGVG